MNGLDLCLLTDFMRKGLLKYSPCLAGLYSPLSSQKFTVQTFFRNDSLIPWTIASNLYFSFISIWEGMLVFVGSCIILCLFFNAPLGIVLTQPRPLHILYFSQRNSKSVLICQPRRLKGSLGHTSMHWTAFYFLQLSLLLFWWECWVFVLLFIEKLKVCIKYFLLECECK